MEWRRAGEAVNMSMIRLKKHCCNFTLKSGGDQWRRQDFVLGGTTIEAPKARASRCQRRRVGDGCPLPSRLGVWGSVVSSPSGVRGRAPAAIAFSAYLRPQNASGSKKNTILLPKVSIPLWKVAVTVTTTFKSGGDKSPSSHTKFNSAYAKKSIISFISKISMLAKAK